MRLKMRQHVSRELSPSRRSASAPLKATLVPFLKRLATLAWASSRFGLRRTPCRVSCVPGVSPPHPEMAYAKDAAMWALDDGKGNAFVMLYVPSDK